MLSRNGSIAQEITHLIISLSVKYKRTNEPTHVAMYKTQLTFLSPVKFQPTIFIATRYNCYQRNEKKVIDFLWINRQVITLDNVIFSCRGLYTSSIKCYLCERIKLLFSVNDILFEAVAPKCNKTVHGFIEICAKAHILCHCMSQNTWLIRNNWILCNDDVNSVK